jgi:hypothetical protein
MVRELKPAIGLTKLGQNGGQLDGPSVFEKKVAKKQ